ncbi:PREDICTED: putative F-box/kelch-repeat protein At1g12870-like [Fragaria vesca subsp. vesca]
MSSCFDLPEDIIVKILCRLPVKSLIRFTCVSKRWRSIISDPKFGKSHFQLASKLRTLCRKVLLISYPSVREPGPRPSACYDPTTKLPPRFQSLDDKFSVKKFTFPSEEHAEMKKMGSCNGLLLLGQHCYRNLSLWNLSTGFCRKISNPCLRLRSIHSADGNSLNETSDPVIYAFDLATEEFRRVTLPPVLWQNEEGNNPTKITTVVHLGGYLCIWSRKRFCPRKNEVWAMTVHGVRESYDTGDLCFITESGTMVIKLLKELFWIECRNEEKPICSGRYRLEEVYPGVPGCSFYFDATGYDETLVSVAE